MSYSAPRDHAALSTSEKSQGSVCHVLGRDGPCRKNVRIAPVVARWDQWQRDREQLIVAHLENGLQHLENGLLVQNGSWMVAEDRSVGYGHVHAFLPQNLKQLQLPAPNSHEPWTAIPYILH